MNRGRKLRAPTADRAWLVDPPWPELPALYRSLDGPRPSRNYDVQGLSLDRLSVYGYGELFECALDETGDYRGVELPDEGWGTIVFAGHQPELFHPGVWAKNFALAALAKSVNTYAINLMIDGDVLTRPTIRVPTGTVDEPHVEEIAFDAMTEPLPYEMRRIVDRAAFESFGKRVSEAVRPFVDRPLIDTYWPLVLEEARESDLIGRCFARARHRLEEMWGLSTLEVPQSRVCKTTAFRWFTAHLLANLPRFHEAHNGALDEYRRVEHIRSEGRPVPPLARDGEWYEAPFWIWHTDDPQRRRLFARSVGNETELTDRDRLTWRLPLSADGSAEAAVEWIKQASFRGFAIRSRALITTMFVRFVLDRLFLHGIGGGKYDELTDEIVRRFFAFEPPGYAVVTATRRLPIPLPPHDDETEAGLKHRLWELAHHPERFLTGEAAAEAAPWIEQKRHWTAVEPTRETGRERCHAIRDANVAIQAFTAEQVRRTTEMLTTVRHRDRVETTLTSREFSSFLFPEKDLREFLLAFPH